MAKKINIDGNKATLRGLESLGKEDPRWRQVEVRARRYLNNVVEQDHRAIKQRCAFDARTQVLWASTRSASIKIENLLALRAGKTRMALMPSVT